MVVNVASTVLGSHLQI